MLNVTALTSGKYVPSSRFRVRQFIRPLYSLGISVKEYPLPFRKYTPRLPAPMDQALEAVKLLGRVPGLAASRSSDITWLERELSPRRFTLERFAGGKILFDVDDAIWLTSDSRFSEEIATCSAGVIAGNSFIAEHYKQFGVRTWVVPTSINTERWSPASKRRQEERWTVGWVGTSSNLSYLYSVEEPLAAFLGRFPETRLLVVCDRKPLIESIAKSSWQFRQWSPDNEVDTVREMDVGLMPLLDDEWSRGKCAFKMLSYMAVGIPVVSSAVGVNKDLLEQADVGLPASCLNDWYEALYKLFQDRALALVLGSNGKELVERRYSVAANVGTLARIFKEVA
jgi:glycosyltransferase involved in cell wall biosynthesis